MRNWNWTLALSRICLCHGSQTTYEELKLAMLLWWFHRESCSQTTYEELKQGDSLTIESSSFAPRLPMRNWNPKQNVGGRYEITGSQTTYEELKHEDSFRTSKEETAPRLPMRNWNLFGKFDWWLHVKAPRLPMRNWNMETSKWTVRSTLCSQTTYEELKPLPSYFHLHKFPLLPDYLWGIETNIKSKLLNHSTWLPDYLWGIETLGVNTRYDMKTCSQTTYEELKRVGLIKDSWA